MFYKYHWLDSRKKKNGSQKQIKIQRDESNSQSTQTEYEGLTMKVKK